MTNYQTLLWMQRADAMREGVIAHLHAHYGPGDLSWHPLWIAARELWHFIMWREEGREAPPSPTYGPSVPL